MFNRIRVVTMLMMMVLGVFALLQLVSGGLLFSSLQRAGFCYFLTIALATKRTVEHGDLILQTRINLSRFAHA